MSIEDHLPRVTAESRRALLLSLDILAHHSIPYALIGGWAVYGYGSRIPSIDTDILLTSNGAEQFRRQLGESGQADLEGPGKHIEILAMNEPNELHGFDWELEEVPAYTPSEVLDGKLVVQSINLDGMTVDATMPSPSALAFMKLKAMHDRCFDYGAVTDPTKMARINPSDRPLIAREPAAHYLRKAGKDLSDTAFLCSVCTEVESALGEYPALQPHLQRALSQVPQPIHDYAVGMASQHVGSRAWIRDYTTAW